MSVENKEIRCLTNEDFWRLRTISEFRLSPDGERVAYTVNWLDEDTDSARSAVWMLDLRAGSNRQLTEGESSSDGALPRSGMGGGSAIGGGESQPRWSPEGSRIAYVGTSPDGSKQIYVQSLAAGGDTRVITTSAGGAFSPAWAPDGRTIAFIAAEPSDAHLVPLETEWLKKHPNVDASSQRLRHVTALKYRLEGRGYVDSHTHLFTVDAEGGQVHRLTDGPYDDGPPSWSPDGNELVFSTNRDVDPEATLTTLWSLHIATGETRRLNGRPMSDIVSPTFSPDGRLIAYYGAVDNAERGYLTGLHLWVVSREGRDETNVSAELDRQSYLTFHEHYGLIPVESPCWSPDSSRLYFNAADHGDEAVFSVSASGGPATRISTQHAQAFAPQLTRDEQTVLCLASTPTRPFEVCAVPAAGGSLVARTDANPWLRECRGLVEPELISFTGPHGVGIQGWLIRPSVPTEDAGYPLILHVHGGPYLGWANTFYFQYQALAAAGFASLYINPRGSAGYGQAFARLRDYGEDDFRDLMLGVDAVLERGHADRTRLAVTGLSYGGFMTNWIIGQTDRFAAALTVNGLASWLSMQSSSDIGGRWPGFEWGGNYWDSDEMCEMFRRHSPITYIRNVKTPLMLFGSECDYRVPIEQEELMLTALRVQGKPVEMIRFPNANHIIATSAAPRHRVMQWQLAQEWFERWLTARN